LRQKCTWPAEADDDASINNAGAPDDRRSSVVVVAQETPRRRESEAHDQAGQRGEGSSQHQQSHLESRLHSLESTISHVLDTLHSVSAAGTLHSLSSEVLHPANPQEIVSPSRETAKRPAEPSDKGAPRDSPRKRSRIADEGIPPWKQVEAVAGHYLKYCEGQPLYLFHRESFVRSLRFRPEELLLAILAVTLRFQDADESPRVQSGGDRNTSGEERYEAKDSLTLAGKAHALVMAKIGTRAIELSTLQTLCLLAFVHFHGK